MKSSANKSSIKTLLKLETSSLSNYSAPDSVTFSTIRGNQLISSYYKDLKRTRKRHNDSRDVNVNPSYTKRKPQYVLFNRQYILDRHIYIYLCSRAVCSERSSKDYSRYNDQFLYEISQLALYQENAYDAARFHRVMSYTSLWPPFHTKKELGYTQGFIFKRDRKHLSDLYHLLKTNVQ